MANVYKSPRWSMDNIFLKSINSNINQIGSFDAYKCQVNIEYTVELLITRTSESLSEESIFRIIADEYLRKTFGLSSKQIMKEYYPEKLI
jgi:CTP-dependent riboflavin kinase